jgi:hypothetical protein
MGSNFSGRPQWIRTNFADILTPFESNQIPNTSNGPASSLLEEIPAKGSINELRGHAEVSTIMEDWIDDSCVELNMELLVLSGDEFKKVAIKTQGRSVASFSSNVDGRIPKCCDDLNTDGEAGKCKFGFEMGDRRNRRFAAIIKQNSERFGFAQCRRTIT